MKEAAYRVLVVGLGNPARGDDGIGPLVAERLAGLLPPDVTVAPPGANVLSLVTEWADFDAVVCVDAAAPLTTPGHIHRFDLATTELPREIGLASSHVLGLAEAIGLSRVLHLAPRDVIVFAVEGASFVGGGPMAPEIAAAAPEVAARVLAEVVNLRRRSNKVAPES
jgi:hydrogenase maturation protease